MSLKCFLTATLFAITFSAAYTSKSLAKDTLLSPGEQTLIQREAAKLKLNQRKRGTAKYSKDNPYAAKIRSSFERKMPVESVKEANERRSLTRSEREKSHKIRRRDSRKLGDSAGKRFKQKTSQRLFGR